MQFGYIAGKADNDALRVRLEVPHACKLWRVLDDVRRSQHCLDELKPFTGKLERRRPIARVWLSDRRRGRENRERAPDLALALALRVVRGWALAGDHQRIPTVPVHQLEVGLRIDQSLCTFVMTMDAGFHERRPLAVVHLRNVQGDT